VETLSVWSEEDLTKCTSERSFVWEELVGIPPGYNNDVGAKSSNPPKVFVLSKSMSQTCSGGVGRNLTEK
jgi:hypothetical protein